MKRKVQWMFWGNLAALLLWGMAMSSCKTHEKLVYFQDGSLSSSDSTVNFVPRYKTGDFLSILVTAENAASVEAFNLPATNITGSNNNGYENGIPERLGYIVNPDSTIIFPVLGKVKIAGLSLTEATDLLAEKLSPYVENPKVQIQILNFKVTVLGDVKNPGTFKIPNERITLLEALGLAGDLNITGNRKTIYVVRDNNGQKEEYTIDITKKDVFSSPAYYLTQNDVVYVEPNRAARNNSTIWKTSGSIFISTAALIITTISVILK